MTGAYVFGGYFRTLDHRIVTARKEHRCEQCRQPIEKGERYVSDTSIIDSEFQFSRWHVDCWPFKPREEARDD